MKIKKIEITAAVVISVVLVSAVYFNMNFQSSRTEWRSSGLPQSYLSGKTGETGATQSGVVERIKLIRQSIVASLKQGTFEDVVADIENETEFFSGYVYSEFFNFKDDLWEGEMVSKVPNVNASSFVFSVRGIISDNGEVLSITVSIEDVTGVNTGEEVPYASIKIAMKEEPSEGAKPTVSSVLGGALPILTESLIWVVRGVVIFVPLSFAALSLILLTTRLIIPIWSKTIRPTKEEKVEGSTPT